MLQSLAQHTHALTRVSGTSIYLLSDLQEYLSGINLSRPGYVC